MRQRRSSILVKVEYLEAWCVESYEFDLTRSLHPAPGLGVHLCLTRPSSASCTLPVVVSCGLCSLSLNSFSQQAPHLTVPFVRSGPSLQVGEEASVCNSTLCVLVQRVTSLPPCTGLCGEAPRVRLGEDGPPWRLSRLNVHLRQSRGHHC